MDVILMVAKQPGSASPAAVIGTTPTIVEREFRELGELN